ncbi:MAG: hypothetical protein ABID61_01750 [Candidatus Micrarchaeota archaeon]
MKKLIFLLFVISLSLASSGVFFNQLPQDPAVAVPDQAIFILTLMAPLMLAMVILAAAAYVAGQLFGSEIRAKASVWAQSMLVAVGIVAIIIFLFVAVLPGFFSGTLLGFDLYDPFLGHGKINEILNIAQSGLGLLIAAMMVLAAAAYVVGQMFGSETRARATTWANNILAGSILAAAIYIIIFNIIIPFQTDLFNQPLAGGVDLGFYGALLVDIALLVSIIILVTYLISRVFKIPEWEAYLNIELSHLMSSFVLIIFVIGMFAVGEAVVSSNELHLYDSIHFSGPPEAAISFMHTTVSDSALKASMDIFKIQACASMLSTFSRRTGEFVLTQTYKVFPGVDTFVSVANVLSYTLVSFYGTVSVQIALLHLIDGLMVSFVLPAGLVLRFFPPTRDAGAFLISLSFGFQFIFPTVYLINGQIFESIGAETYKSPKLLIQSLCGPFKYGAAGYLFNPAASPLFKIPGFNTLGTLLGKIVSEGLLNAVSMAEFIPILQRIASLSLLVLFMPALALMITIAFINSMTKFIINKG